MLEQECEATAAYVASLFKRSPDQTALPDTALVLFEDHLAALLKSVVRLTKKRELEEVQIGRRAISLSLETARRDSLIAQAGDYADIPDLAVRLAFAREWRLKMFSGYVLVLEGEASRVVYPPIQAHIDAIQQAFDLARVTTQGKFITAPNADHLRLATLQVTYPPYYVYTVEERQSTQSSRWLQIERVGRDQLVAVLAAAYHKGYWFVHEQVAWKPH
jgi:hypothetical protein